MCGLRGLCTSRRVSAERGPRLRIVRRRVLSAAGWIAGWIVNPAVAWGALSGVGAATWAGLAGLPAVVVALIALAALTLGVVLAHYALALRDWQRPASTK